MVMHLNYYQHDQVDHYAVSQMWLQTTHQKKSGTAANLICFDKEGKINSHNTDFNKPLRPCKCKFP